MIKVFSVAVIGTVSFVLLKKYSPEFTVVSEIGAVIFLIFFIYPHVCDLIDLIKTYGTDSGINNEYMNIIVKALGISLVTQFSSDMCKDAGETALASKTEFAGKVIMIASSVPIIKTLFELTVRLIDAG